MGHNPKRKLKSNVPKRKLIYTQLRSFDFKLEGVEGLLGHNPKHKMKSTVPKRKLKFTQLRSFDFKFEGVTSNPNFICPTQLF